MIAKPKTALVQSYGRKGAKCYVSMKPRQKWEVTAVDENSFAVARKDIKIIISRNIFKKNFVVVMV